MNSMAGVLFALIYIYLSLQHRVETRIWLRLSGISHVSIGLHSSFDIFTIRADILGTPSRHFCGREKSLSTNQHCKFRGLPLCSNCFFCSDGETSRLNDLTRCTLLYAKFSICSATCVGPKRSRPVLYTLFDL